jgi:hypothetical protein
LGHADIWHRNEHHYRYHGDNQYVLHDRLPALRPRRATFMKFHFQSNKKQQCNRLAASLIGLSETMPAKPLAFSALTW